MIFPSIQFFLIHLVCLGLTETREKAYLMATVRTVDQVKWADGLDQHIISLLLKAVEENNGFIPSQ